MERLAILLFLVGAGCSVALLLTSAHLGTAGASDTVSCGDTITVNTTLTSDLTDCVGSGLVIGADSITLDCDGHTIDGDDSGSDYGVYLSGRSWDTIQDCVITDFGTGIFLGTSSNNTLTGNTTSSNGLGILLNASSSNTVTGNTADSNSGGISITWSTGGGASNNSVVGNTVRNNRDTGLTLNATDNTASSNEVCSNKLDISSSSDTNSGDENTCLSTANWDDTGIEGCTFACPVEPVCYCSTCSECNDRLRDDCPVVQLTADIVDQSGTCIEQDKTFNGEVFDCQGHTIDGDDSGSDYGVYLSGRSWDTIQDCVITDFGTGIFLGTSSNNTLTGNTTSSNGLGILLNASSSNTVTGNTADSNSDAGVSITWSTGGSARNNSVKGNTVRDNQGTGLHINDSENLIYNNYVDNAHNASAPQADTWNVAKTPGTNIVGGAYLGGNYWGDYAGVDTDGDGLGDTGLPYNCNGNIQNGGDYTPLVPVSGPVGGIAELPDIAGTSAAEAEMPGAGSGWSSDPAAQGVGLAAGLLGLTVAVWYVKRRWLRRRA